MVVVTARERALRAEVRHALSTAEVQTSLARFDTAVVAGEEPDPRPLYRLLGARRLLAVHWPLVYGGRDGTSLEHAAVVEEFTLAGVPDTLHTLSVQIVGSFLLTAGSRAQRAELLPAIAAGELGAAVLYTEPAAGSDLAGLSTRAEPAAGGGWELTGRKVYGVKSRYADVGLCLARTADAATPYQGLTLFLVPLAAAGVQVSQLDAVADEAFADVTLDGVRVEADAVVGPVGGAWPLVTGALALERTGTDTAAKARRWLDAAVRAMADGDCLDADVTAETEVSLGRLSTEVETARLLARRAAEVGAALAPVTGARTKWWCAETARRVTWWATDALGPAGLLGRADPEARAQGLLEAAYREAPGLTISAGTSEVLLDLAAAGLSADAGPDEPDDAVAAQLARAVRATLVDDDPEWASLAELGLFRFLVPVAAGGLDLGFEAVVATCVELGRAGVDGGLLDTLSAVDLFAADELLDRILAGELRASIVDSSGRGYLAAGADLLVVPVRGGWQLVNQATRGVGVRSSTAGWDRVEVDPAQLAAGVPAPVRPPTADRIRRAAWLTGLAAGGLGLTVQRVRERRQFGRAVADNQVVAHWLARSAIGVDAVRLLVAEAAIRADAGDARAGVTATGAVAAAGELALDVLRSGVQLHGAYGTTAAAPIARLFALAPLAVGRAGRLAALWREVGRSATGADQTAPLRGVA